MADLNTVTKASELLASGLINALNRAERYRQALKNARAQFQMYQAIPPSPSVLIATAERNIKEIDEALSDDGD